MITFLLRCALPLLCLLPTVQAQDLRLRPSVERIVIRDGDGGPDALFQQLRSAGARLLVDQGDAKSSRPGALDGQLVVTVSQNGKTLYRGRPQKVRIGKSGALPLAENGLEAAMIATWERQGFVRRQIGRIEKENKGGSLGKPPAVGEKQGFTRRQIGRIPKQQYEVEVRLDGVPDRGTTQPARFLVVIL